MPLFRVRTEIEDRPGRLALLTAALARRGANILGLSVQMDTGGVVDEFIVDVPRDGAGARELAETLAAAGGTRTAVRPARPRELVDEPTRVLALAARLRAEPRAVAEILAELLRADDARLLSPAEAAAHADAGAPANAPTSEGRDTGGDGGAGRDTGGGIGGDGGAGAASGGAGAGGVGGDKATGSGGDEGGDAGGDAGEDKGRAGEDRSVLIVPVGRGRAVRLLRVGLPFTTTEAARADALIRAALPGGRPVPASRRVLLRDGTHVVVRPIGLRDAGAVRALHGRCSADSRRMRYFGPKPHLPQRAVELFCQAEHGLTLVAEGPDGSLLALAHLIHLVHPGVAELAFLVEDGWQGRGLGRALAELLVVAGRERGLVELRATALSENARMRRLLTSLGGRTVRTAEPGIVEMRLGLAGRAAATPVSART